VVAVAGRFDTQRAYEQLSEAIANRRASASPPSREAPAKFFTWTHREDRFKQVQIYTGTTVPTTPGEHGPLYDALTFSNAVGESMSSRLFQKIREEYALCYSISCFRSLYTDISLWTIYSNSSPNLVVPLLEAVNEEMSRLLTDPLTDGEVEDAKSHLKGTLILSKEDMEVRMKRLVRQYSLVRRVLEYEESLRYIDEVTRERVLDFATQTIKSANFNLLVYGEKRIKNFKDIRFTF
jgi:predicted Zn-dependent peptidase